MAQSDWSRAPHVKLTPIPYALTKTAKWVKRYRIVDSHSQLSDKGANVPPSISLDSFLAFLFQYARRPPSKTTNIQDDEQTKPTWGKHQSGHQKKMPLSPRHGSNRARMKEVLRWMEPTRLKKIFGQKWWSVLRDQLMHPKVPTTKGQLKEVWVL